MKHVEEIATFRFKFMASKVSLLCHVTLQENHRTILNFFSMLADILITVKCFPFITLLL